MFNKKLNEIYKWYNTFFNINKVKNQKVVWHPEQILANLEIM